MFSEFAVHVRRLCGDLNKECSKIHFIEIQTHFDMSRGIKMTLALNELK